MCRKIRCDKYYAKIFRFWGHLNGALDHQQNRCINSKREEMKHRFCHRYYPCLDKTPVIDAPTSFGVYWVNNCKKNDAPTNEWKDKA